MGLFDRVEAKLERAVNGAFARAFKSEVQPVEIASAIRRAMDDRAAVVGRGRTFVPNLFTVELSSTDYDRLGGYGEDLEQELVAAALEHAESQRYQPAGPLRVDMVEADELETGVFRVRPQTAKDSGSAAPSYAASPRPPVAPAPPAGGPFDHGDQMDDLDQPTELDRPELPPARSRRVNPSDRPWLDIDGERYPLMGAITILGRDDIADVILDDPGISRRHSEIRVTQDGPRLVSRIRDLDSTNGTFLNGERVTAGRLEDGDRLTVGRTNIVFRAGR